jgi:ATP-dependent Clp protease adapter protein ClpS|tara:strand:+ start:1484 stop:1723 length:240 start_codon:yes stop_codon:yes gene_type:complete
MSSRLYLLNDNIHTYDDVVFVLKQYLGYPDLQGSSIADLIHRTGRCEIKIGEFEDLEFLKEMLMKEGYNLQLENDYEGY